MKEQGIVAVIVKSCRNGVKLSDWDLQKGSLVIIQSIDEKEWPITAFVTNFNQRLFFKYEEIEVVGML